MTRTFLIIALALMTTGTAAVGQDAPARFHIEGIEVRGTKRVSADVIVAESRLRAGNEYSEAELSDAAARLNRLPFLLSAEFALEKGSARGRHLLVVTVTETKPFFYLLDIRPILSGSTDSGQTNVTFADDVGDNNEGVLGARWFVGRRGAFHTGLFARYDNHEFTQDYTAAVVGYTQYDLFGTRAFATLNLKLPLLDVPSGSTISPQVVVGVPLSPNQTLAVTYDETRFNSEYSAVNGVRIQRQNAERLVSARWSYNTTNDPFVPTRGTLVSVTPLVTQRDRVSFSVVQNPAGGLSTVPIAVHTNAYGISLEVQRYFELSERNSISASGEAGWGRLDQRQTGRADIDRDTTYRIAQAGFSRSLWSREQQQRGDSRLEYTLRYVDRDRAQRYVGPLDDDELQAGFAWVRRSSFGTIRLGVGYGW